MTRADRDKFLSAFKSEKFKSIVGLCVLGGVFSEVHKPVSRKEASLYFRSDFLTALYGKVVKGGKDYSVSESVFVNKLYRSSFDGGIFVNTCFQFDVCDYLCVLYQLEVFS